MNELDFIVNIAIVMAFSSNNKQMNEYCSLNNMVGSHVIGGSILINNRRYLSISILHLMNQVFGFTFVSHLLVMTRSTDDLAATRDSTLFVGTHAGDGGRHFFLRRGGGGLPRWAGVVAAFDLYEGF